jgi:hypothetical protein
MVITAGESEIPMEFDGNTLTSLACTSVSFCMIFLPLALFLREDHMLNCPSGTVLLTKYKTQMMSDNLEISQNQRIVSKHTTIQEIG